MQGAVFSPPRDEKGEVTPHDAPNLKDHDSVLRRIRNDDNHICYDENIQGHRISNAAYSATNRDPHHGMSTDIEHELLGANINIANFIGADFGAVRLRVGELRALKLKVGVDPIKNHSVLEDNPYHAQAWGVKDSKRKHVAQIVECWVVAIPGVALR